MRLCGLGGELTVWWSDRAVQAPDGRRCARCVSHRRASMGACPTPPPPVRAQMAGQATGAASWRRSHPAAGRRCRAVSRRRRRMPRRGARSPCSSSCGGACRVGAASGRGHATSRPAARPPSTASRCAPSPRAPVAAGSRRDSPGRTSRYQASAGGFDPVQSRWFAQFALLKGSSPGSTRPTARSGSRSTSSRAPLLWALLAEAGRLGIALAGSDVTPDVIVRGPASVVLDASLDGGGDLELAPRLVFGDAAEAAARPSTSNAQRPRRSR